MGFGFAAGNGAEDVKVFNPHGPEFGKMGFEGGEDVVGLGHERRIAEKRGEVKSAGGADKGCGRLRRGYGIRAPSARIRDNALRADTGYGEEEGRASAE